MIPISITINLAATGCTLGRLEGWSFLIMLGGITAFFLGIMIFLIYAMDHPLQGAVSVPPDLFRSVYDLVMKWDEPA